MDVASSFGGDLDTFTLIVKNLPKNVQGANAETLLDFVKRLTWQENVEIVEVGLNDHSVKFINVPTDAEEVIGQLKSETYLGIHLDVVQVKKLKKLYLGNLKPDVQSMAICLYLEQPKFHPSKEIEDYRVEVLHIDRNRKFALVKLPDEADIDAYVNAEHSDILGEGLRVKEYIKTRREDHQNRDRRNTGITRRGRGGLGRGGKGHQGKCDVVKNASAMKTPVQSHQQPTVGLPPPPVLQDPNVPIPLRGLPFVEWINVSEVDREKCHLMKKHLADLKKLLDPGWKIWIDDKLHTIGIGHCDGMKLGGVIYTVQEKLASMTSTFLQLPKEFALALKSSRGISFIIKLLDARQLKAVYYFDPRKGRGMVLGENREVARRAAEVLAEEFCQHIFETTLDIEEQRIDQEWKNFSSSIMKDHMVHVSLVVAEYGAGVSQVKKVMAQGFKGDPSFSKAKTSIEQKLIKLSSGSTLTGQKVSNNEKHQDKHQIHHQVQPLMSGMTPKNFNFSKSKPKNIAIDQRHSINSNDVPSSDRMKPAELEVVHSVKMSPLVYKFFKIHQSKIILNGKCKYSMAEQNLVIKGKEEEVLQILSSVQDVMTSMVEKQAIIKIAGITEGFYNEKNGELRLEISKFELSHTFAIDFKTNKDKDTILNYAFQKQNQKANKFQEMIKELLMSLSKKKFIRCSDMFANIGLPGGIVTEKLRDSISKVEHGHVKVKYDSQSDAILLQGREKFFTVVEKALIDIFKEHSSDNQPQKLSTNQKKIDMNLGMRTENLSDFLRAFGLEDVFAPDHWSKFTGNLRHVSGDKGQIVLLSPNSKTFKYVKDMVQSTWTNGQVGVGRDASLLNHRNIEVINIYSVENVSQYKRYMTRLKEFCLQNGGNGFSRLDSSLCVPVLTISAAERNGLQNLLWEVNEYHLFHGTRPESRQAIIDQGLDSRLGSRHALFGQGIYFAESSTKADQYADPKENRSTSGDNLYMFVARVCMGRMYEARRPLAYIRPPCNDPLCSSDKCSIHPLNDSVIGTHTTTHTLTYYNFLTTKLKAFEDREMLSASESNSREIETIQEKLKMVRPLLFREFIVYDHSQCFPEFLVEYKRL